MINLQKTCEFIAGWESFEPNVYLDQGGVETIGYGETSPSIIKQYRKTGITEEQAWELLENRVQAFADQIEPWFTRPISQNQHGAFTSLTYNIGADGTEEEPGFRESTALKRFNDGDIPGAAQALKWWNKVDGQISQGLVNRRDKEYDWFLTPDVVNPPPPQPTSASGVLLTCANSGLVLDVEGNSPDPGAKIQQYPAHGDWNQCFAFMPAPKGPAGTVIIVAMHSSLVLDVTGWSVENGAEICQWEYHGGNNQLWRLETVGPNIFKIVNVHSGKVLDVQNLSIDAGARLQQWDWLDGPNQKFFRTRIAGTHPINVVITPPPPPPVEPPKPPPPDNFNVAAALKQIGFPTGDAEDVYGFQGGFSFYDLTVDGVAGPQTIAAIQFSIDRGGRCGEFFTFSEFGCKHCGRPRIWREQVRALDAYRRHLRMPVPIISGTRCDEHNKAVGGATNSQHRPYPTNRGVSMASDIPGALSRQDMIGLQLFSGIGYVASDGLVVHVDSRGDGPNNTTGGSKTSPTTWAYA